uniref:Uncharacterized protein n=1 Tax=Cacopsylla melanoneura TaxID=428564 RepID=A0A8D9EVW0_9HEMI
MNCTCHTRERSGRAAYTIHLRGLKSSLRPVPCDRSFLLHTKNHAYVMFFTAEETTRFFKFSFGYFCRIKKAIMLYLHVNCALRKCHLSLQSSMDNESSIKNNKTVLKNVRK